MSDNSVGTQNRFKLSQTNMFSLLRHYFDLFIDSIFGLFYELIIREKKVPKPSDNLVMQSAVTLAKKIRNRELTSEQVVLAFIHRINQVNPLVNAVVDNRFDKALEEAQKIDEKIAWGAITDEDFDRKPFLGVPFTVKEIISAKGLSHTLGLVSRKSYKATFDAEVVGKLKSAGAILLGVTNIPQLSCWTETTNPIYGTTYNPYNTTRTPGGSSGGEGCIVAACGSPFGIGTDLGGSIRIPAFSCGVFGHKPSIGLVPTQGVMFGDSHRDCLGPLTRHAEDIVPILKVLVDDLSKVKLDEKIDVKDIKVYYIMKPEDPYISQFTEETNQAMAKCVEHFAKILPEEPQLLNLEELTHAAKMWLSVAAGKELKSFNRNLTNRQADIDLEKELIRYFVCLSNFNIFTILLLVAHVFSKGSEAASEMVSTLRDKLIAALGTNGVLLYPSAPFPASYHYTSIFRFHNINLFSVWNALNFTVTQVPLGLNAEGLPLGVQVVAPPYQDHLTIAVAEELERAFGGYVPPFDVDK